MGVVEVRTAVPLHDGLALPYAQTGPADGSTPLVLLHAYVESWRYFHPVLRALPASVRAVAPTQRGHRSVVGEVRSHGVDDLASDVVALMDVVGVDRAVLVGASSGGLVAQRLAASEPSRVAGLVLISSPVTLAGTPGVDVVREQVMALTDPVDPGFVERFVRATAPAGLADDLVATLVQESLGVPAAAWQASLAALLQVRAAPLERIAVPTLLLSGADDDVVRDDQQVLLDRVPDVEQVVYDGVGHSPHLARPERVAADLVTFLSAVTGRGGRTPSRPGPAPAPPTARRTTGR